MPSAEFFETGGDCGVGLFTNPVYVGGTETCGFDRFVNDDMYLPTPEEPHSRRPYLPSPMNRDRHDGHPGIDPNAKRTRLEDLDGTVDAASTLGEHDEGKTTVAGLFHTGVDCLANPRTILTVDLDHAERVHRLGEYRDLVELFFGQEADLVLSGQKRDGDIEVRQVIRDENELTVVALKSRPIIHRQTRGRHQQERPSKDSNKPFGRRAVCPNP